MTYTLVGSRYIGSGTLPTPVAGYDAVDTTTGTQYQANASATAWVTVGNVNQTNLGLLPKTGGQMTGAITGTSGLSPVDSPDFTTTATLMGIPLATSTTLATTESNILNNIAPKIQEAVAASSVTLTVKSNIAIATGTKTFTSSTPQTIAVPTYPDGTSADPADCKWVVGLKSGYWPCGRSDSNGDTNLAYDVEPTSNRTFALWLKDAGGNYYNCEIAYMIIAVRS